MYNCTYCKKQKGKRGHIRARVCVYSTEARVDFGARARARALPSNRLYTPAIRGKQSRHGTPACLTYARARVLFLSRPFATSLFCCRSDISFVKKVYVRFGYIHEQVAFTRVKYCLDSLIKIVAVKVDLCIYRARHASILEYLTGRASGTLARLWILDKSKRKQTLRFGMNKATRLVMRKMRLAFSKLREN